MMASFFLVFFFFFSLSTLNVYLGGGALFGHGVSSKFGFS